MGKAKEQHYIPQSIIRNWSDNGKTINIWIGSNEEKKEASISDQFKKKYLYGTNPKIETELFANDIEPKIKEFIREIKEKRTIIDDDRPQRFILSSLFRTKFFIELNEFNIKKIAACICKDVNKLGYDEEKLMLETLKELDLLENNNKIKGYIDMYNQCDSLWPIVRTLKRTTLLKTNKEFVIGEIPVVFICLTMGKIIDPLFIITYPISPKELLVLSRPEDGYVDHNRFLTDSETHILNSYQFQQTENIIAFKTESKIDFDIFENQYGKINKYDKLIKFQIGNSPDDFVYIPNSIQSLHFYYDEGLRQIIT